MGAECGRGVELVFPPNKTYVPMGEAMLPPPSEFWMSQYGETLENAYSETDICFMIPQRSQALMETEPKTESLGWDLEEIGCEGLQRRRSLGHSRHIQEMTTENRINIRTFGQACRVGGLAGPPVAVSIRQRDDLPGNTFEPGHKALMR